MCANAQQFFKNLYINVRISIFLLVKKKKKTIILRNFREGTWKLPEK